MWWGGLVAGMFLALGLTAQGEAVRAAARVAPAATRGPAYELCIEQSPAQAGKLSPDSGTHQVSADAVVVLSAEPQPGYQFAYWLGDVTDPKSQRTTVQVSSSKVVVAVFQPAEADTPRLEFLGGGGGGGGAVPTRVDLSVPGWSVAGGGPVRTEAVAVSVPAKVPTPVPEPTTIALLALGAAALGRRRGASPDLKC
jgi:hypothetical protein